jgi:ABC-type sugar transport system substrate-binding protein
LAEKAVEGVKARVLYDWFGSMDVPRSFWQRLRKTGVEVRAVNPSSSPKQSSESDYNTALQVTEDILTANPDLDAI